MSSGRRMDLTTGAPMKQILLFSLPLVLGSLFQQLYSFVDTIMVGRLISNDALAAVGSVSSLNFLVVGFVGGTCNGFAIPMSSVGTGMATFAGQNDGAKRYDRLKEGLKSAICIQLCYSILACVVLNVGKGAFAALILGKDSGMAGDYAIRYLTVMSFLFWVNGTMFALRNTLTGMGYSSYSVFSGICELAGKAIGAWIAVRWFGFWGICAATPLAWFLAMLYCGFWVRRFLRQRLRTAAAL